MLLTLSLLLVCCVYAAQHPLALARPLQAAGPHVGKGAPVRGNRRSAAGQHTSLLPDDSDGPLNALRDAARCLPLRPYEEDDGADGGEGQGWLSSKLFNRSNGAAASWLVDGHGIGPWWLVPSALSPAAGAGLDAVSGGEMDEAKQRRRQLQQAGTAAFCALHGSEGGSRSPLRQRDEAWRTFGDSVHVLMGVCTEQPARRRERLLRCVGLHGGGQGYLQAGVPPDDRQGVYCQSLLLCGVDRFEALCDGLVPLLYRRSLLMNERQKSFLSSAEKAICASFSTTNGEDGDGVAGPQVERRLLTATAAAEAARSILLRIQAHSHRKHVLEDDAMTSSSSIEKKVTKRKQRRSPTQIGDIFGDSLDAVVMSDNSLVFSL